MSKNKIAEDIRHLNKFKYVYLFYESSGDWVKERFKVIYINKNYVYFKRYGCSTLSYLRRDDVYKLEELEAMLCPNVPPRKVMYYLAECKDDVEEIFKKCVAKKRALKIQKEYYNIMDEYNCLSNDVKLKKERMKNIRKKYPELF